MRPRRPLRITLLTVGVVACLVGPAQGGPAGLRGAYETVGVSDPLYLDPSYYDAYYGYWTEMEAPGAEALA